MSPNKRLPIRVATILSLLLLTIPAWSAFIDNGDGTVTDTATGLIWDKCSWGQTWTGAPPADTCAGDPTRYYWQAALALAVTANSTTHRGYNDWRLPSKNELESLVDIGRSMSPAVNVNAFPNTPSGIYWSSTTVASAPSVAWYVDFSNGGTFAINKEGIADFYVRLVRSGQSFDRYDLLGSAIRIAADPVDGGMVTCIPNPVPYGGSSSCTATANIGYAFESWGDDCSGSEVACTLQDVTEPRRVTARFTRTGGVTVPEVPAVGPWGLSLVASLLVGLGWLQLRRRLYGSRR